MFNIKYLHFFIEWQHCTLKGGASNFFDRYHTQSHLV
jgi:hypothetical protein